MTVSSNLKTRVQNKINAVTGSTTLPELLKLKKAAEGLGCDETALETQLQARLTAMGAGTESTDLLIGSKTSGLAGRSYYTAPFDVSAGDVLYVDQLGGVRKANNSVEATALASQGFVYGSASLVHGSFIQGADSAVALSYTLSNGNTLLIVKGSSTSGNLRYYVISATFKILSSGNLDMAGAYSGASQYYLGCFETAANTFRFYFITANTASEQQKAIAYKTVTYNTGTHLVSASASVSVLDDGYTFYANWASLFRGQRKSARYVPVQATSGVNSRFYILDMQSATLVRYTALDSTASATYQPMDMDLFSVGGEYAIVASSQVASRVCKIGSDVSAALPANVTSFFPSNGASFLRRCITQGTWLIVANTGTPVIKLVKFNADYTSATVWDVFASLPAELDNISVTTISVFTDGTRYWVNTGPGRPVFSFTWDGVSAPTRATVETGFTSSDRVPFSSMTAQLVSASDQMIYTTCFLNQTQAFIRFSPAELFPHAVTEFGTCMADALSGQPVEIELAQSSEAAPSMPSVNMIGYRLHQGILTKLDVRSPMIKLQASRIQNRGSSGAEGSDYYRLESAMLGKGYSVGSFVAKTTGKAVSMLRTTQSLSENFILAWLGVHGAGSYLFNSDGSNTYLIVIHTYSHAPMVIYNSASSGTLVEEKP